MHQTKAAKQIAQRYSHVRASLNERARCLFVASEAVDLGYGGRGDEGSVSDPRFRRQARREVGDRHGAERRYSDQHRQEAVAYWQAREPTGDGLREVATALGIAPVSLRRWAKDGRFRPVRVEGVNVETAAQLFARLR